MPKPNSDACAAAPERPAARPRRSTGLWDVRASVSEDAIDFFDEAADRTGHTRTRYIGMLLNGFAMALVNLPRSQRDLLERLIWERQSPRALRQAFQALEKGLTRAGRPAQRPRSSGR